MTPSGPVMEPSGDHRAASGFLGIATNICTPTEVPFGASVPHTGGVRGPASSCWALLWRGQAENRNTNISGQMDQSPGVLCSYGPHFQPAHSPAPRPRQPTQSSLSGFNGIEEGSLQSRRDGFIHIPACASQESTSIIKGAALRTCLPRVLPDLGITVTLR